MVGMGWRDVHCPMGLGVLRLQHISGGVLVLGQVWHPPHGQRQVFSGGTWDGFCLQCPGSKGEVGLNIISAALKFPSKYLIRETFDFNNK